MGQQVSNNDDKLIAAFKETNYSTMALLKDIMTLNEKSQREFAERKHSELMNAIQQRNN